MFTHPYVCVHLYNYVYVYLHVCISVHACVCMCVCIFMCVCLFVCMYVCACAPQKYETNHEACFVQRRADQQKYEENDDACFVEEACVIMFSYFCGSARRRTKHASSFVSSNEKCRRLPQLCTSCDSARRRVAWVMKKANNAALSYRL